MRAVGIAILFLAAGMVIGVASEPLRVVQSLDVARYVGLWYAVASIPTSFEKQCVQGTTAEYTLLENGQIEVVNTCYDAGGRKDVATGRAWIPDLSYPAKLRVSFVRFLGFWWFSAPYWVIDLAPDYSYAVVGHPSRKFGWILSRTPTLAEDTLGSIIDRIEDQGYTFADFRWIDQSIHLPDTTDEADASDCP